VLRGCIKFNLKPEQQLGQEDLHSKVDHQMNYRNLTVAVSQKLLMLGLFDVAFYGFSIDLADRSVELAPRPHMPAPKPALKLRVRSKEPPCGVAFEQANEFRY
jgi:hypothetical protein